MQADSSGYSEALEALIEKINHHRAEIDALRPLSLEQEGRVMQKFRLDWNYHSNAIEGNSLTYGETIAFLMEGLTAKGKPFKDHLDIKGHNDAVNYLMELVKSQALLTEKTIRELHEITLVETYTNPARTVSGQKVEKPVALGAYKTMPNHVRTPTGEIHYYASPEETPAKMADLVDWLRGHRQKRDMHTLVLATYFHHRFVSIHPFDDGNGRMSRLLMNLLFLQDGFPPVVIKQQDRTQYYAALRQADAGEMEPFLLFIGENLVHSMEVYLRGARGERIEDPDDLDKEIALLKAGLPKEKVVKTRRSPEVVRADFERVIKPFLLGVYENVFKFSELFSEFKTRLRANEASGSTREFSWENMNSNDFLRWNDVSDLYVTFEFRGFNRSRTAFNMEYLFGVYFGEFDFELHSKWNGSRLQPTKLLYGEPVASDTVKSWRDAIVRDIIDYIKLRTSND